MNKQEAIQQVIQRLTEKYGIAPRSKQDELTVRPNNLPFSTTVTEGPKSGDEAKAKTINDALDQLLSNDQRLLDGGGGTVRVALAGSANSANTAGNASALSAPAHNNASTPADWVAVYGWGRTVFVPAHVGGVFYGSVEVFTGWENDYTSVAQRGWYGNHLDQPGYVRNGLNPTAWSDWKGNVAGSAGYATSARSADTAERANVATSADNAVAISDGIVTNAKCAAGLTLVPTAPANRLTILVHNAANSYEWVSPTELTVYYKG